MKKYLALILLMLSMVNVQADITTGLIARYTFEQNANDSSGNNYNGTASNITYAAGKIGQAAQFNNVNSSIDVASLANNLPGGNTARSVSFWVFPTTNDNGNMVSWGSSAGNNGRFSVLHQANRSLDIIGNFNDRTSGQILAINTWTHVIVTYDGTNLRFYLNGTLAQTVASAAYNTDATQMLRIGVNATPNNNEYFGGALDEVRIYGRVLSNTDATELYNYTSATVTPATVPTLSEWAVIMLVILMLVSATYSLRRSV